MAAIAGLTQRSIYVKLYRVMITEKYVLKEKTESSPVVDRLCGFYGRPANSEKFISGSFQWQSRGGKARNADA